MSIINWLGQNPRIVALGVVCVAVVLIAAMAFHYDLGWIPALLQRLIGG